ncbi:hypothetical protein HMPREF1584_01009 [Gardnerella vaginalis JCP8481A]|nr:hypothetical protein HMPREF1584_01009 [Gardnerella vaginalis JCP8481A]
MGTSATSFQDWNISLRSTPRFSVFATIEREKKKGWLVNTAFPVVEK